MLIRLGIILLSLFKELQMNKPYYLLLTISHIMASTHILPLITTVSFHSPSV